MISVQTFGFFQIMKTVGQSNSSKFWCYNCKIWIKERHAQNHFNKKAHKEGRSSNKDTRRGRGKKKLYQSKLIKEGIFTKKFLNQQELSKEEENVNIQDNIDESVKVKDNDAISEFDDIKVAKSFQDGHAVSECDPSAQPNWNDGDCDRSVRFSKNSQTDNPDNFDVVNGYRGTKSKNSIASQVTKVLSDEVPLLPPAVHYLVSDPSEYQIWDNHIASDNSQDLPNVPVPNHNYDLRSKLTKSIGSSIPESFHNELDTFLKAARRVAKSASKAQF